MDRGFEDDIPTYIAKIRLHVAADLAAGARVPLRPEQSHYLLNVMRCRAGDRVLLFNGRQGEWSARLLEPQRRAAALEVEARERDQTAAPDLWLLFAPVKRTRTDFIVEKAGELGVSVVQPVKTRRTIASRVAEARLQAIAVEAAEQSGRLDVPAIRPPVDLDVLLSRWPGERNLLFCDETGRGAPVAQALAQAPAGPWAVLIGPEGGFAAEEHRAIAALPRAVPVGLGPRILRSDTAAVAALATLQALAGDWRS